MIMKDALTQLDAVAAMFKIVGGTSPVCDDVHVEFYALAISAAERIAGATSQYVQTLRSLTDFRSRTFAMMTPSVYGVIRALRRDVEAGFVK